MEREGDVWLTAGAMFGQNRSAVSDEQEVTSEAEREESDLAWVSPLLRRFVIILLGCSSLILGLISFFQGESTSEFLVGNKLPLATRMGALGVTWVGGLAIAAASLFFARRSSDPEAAQSDLAQVAAPLIVSAFIPVLFQPTAWNTSELGFLAFVFAVGLALERTLGPALEVVGRRFAAWAGAKRLEPVLAHSAWKFVPPLVVAALVAGYISRIGVLTNISHMKLATSSSDLAEYDNMFFNALNGHPFRSPAIAGHLEDWDTLQGHAQFCLYMLLPFYAISPGAHALLWIQSSIVGLTAVPIYLLGVARLGRFAGLCFVVVYFMMPGVQQPNFYDFHFTPLAMFYVAWLMVFAAKLAADPDNRRFRIGMYSAVALALLCREDISIGVAVFGTFLVLSGSLVRDGLTIFGVATTYFVAMKFVIMPLFGTWWFDNMYEDLKSEGAKGFGAIILTLISNPAYVLRTMLNEAKFLYVLHMTVPVLALWLRRPLLWMAVLPAFVSTLLVTNRPPMYQSSFQYTYLWVPYVIGASIVATRSGYRGRGTLGALLVCAAALSHQLGVFPTGESIRGGFSPKTFEISEAEQKRYKDLREIIDMIPPDAVVGVTEAEGPHVSNRLVMYSLKYTLGPYPEYLLVGRGGIRSERAHLKKALESGKYGVIAQKGLFILAKRGADPKKNGALWRRAGLRPPGAGSKGRPRTPRPKNKRPVVPRPAPVPAPAPARAPMAQP